MYRSFLQGLPLLLLLAGAFHSSWAEAFDQAAPLAENDCLQDANTSLPTTSDSCIWVKIQETVSIERLSRSLNLSVERIAELNDIGRDHLFNPGDWVVLPKSSSHLVGRITAIDSSQIRRSPPHKPPSRADAVVRFGDTVFKIAQRYGLTLSELLRLNPDMATARLAVGSPIRLVESQPERPRMVLGLKPSSSWPNLPGPDEYISNRGVSSIGLVGPFKRTPAAFARFLNSNPRGWEDPSLQTYFYDLYKCHSFPADSTNTMPPSFRCDGGYVSFTDNLGSRRCRLDYVSWSWNSGRKFKAFTCR